MIFVHYVNHPRIFVHYKMFLFLSFFSFIHFLLLLLLLLDLLIKSLLHNFLDEIELERELLTFF